MKVYAHNKGMIGLICGWHLSYLYIFKSIFCYTLIVMSEIVTHPVTSMGGDGQLVVIVEDEAEEAAEQKSQDKDSQKEETISGDDKEESEKGDRDEQEKLTDESQDVVASGSGLTYEDVEMLS